MKKFAVFDIDGTLIRWQLYHAIADVLVKFGYGDPTAFKSVKEARMRWKRREHDESFKDYEHALVEAVDEVFKKLNVSQFNKAVDMAFDQYRDQVYTYTRDLILNLKKKGYFLLAISGSQQEIVEKIAEYYSFDDCVGSNYIQKNGKFTGEKIIRGFDKHKILTELMKKHGLSHEKSMGVGDSAGDITMLEMTERAIAFNPERKLFDHAQKRGWKIVIERKNVVYELRPKDGRYRLKK